MYTGILLGLTILFIVGICMTMLMRLKIGQTLPIACLSIIVVTYLSAAMGIMGTGMLAILVTYVIVLAVCAFRHGKKLGKVYASELVLTPGLLVFVLCCTGLFIFTRNIYASEWDEFSHWCVTVKDMCFTDRLSVFPDSVTGFRSYPPAMALWEYLFANYSSCYNDASVIFAYDLYCLLMMLPVVETVRWKRRSVWQIPLLIVLLFAIPYMIFCPWEGAAWRTTRIEYAIGLTFGYVLFTYYGYGAEQGTVNLTISIALGCSVLGLLKSIGNAFVCFALIPITLDMVVSRKQENKRISWKQLGVIAASWLVGLCIWKLLLAVHGVAEKWNTGTINLQSLITLISGGEEPYRYEVIKLFFKELPKGISYVHGPIHLSYLVYPLVWSGMLFLTGLFSSGKERGEVWRMMVVMLIEYILFALYLLMLYCYVFTDDEGLRLAGITRYFSNICIAFNAFTIELLWKKIVDRWHGVGTIVLVFALLGIVSTDQMSADILEHDRSVENGYRETGFFPYGGIEQEYENTVTDDDRIMVITEDHLGKYVLKKAFIPASVQYYWPEEAEALLAQQEELPFDYVYIDTTCDYEGRLERVLQTIEQIEKEGRIKVLNTDGLPKDTTK